MKYEVKEEVRDEVKEEVRSEVKEEAIEGTKHQIIIAAYLEGANHTFIATITQMPVKEVENIIEKYKTEKKVKK
jgi:NADH:ubiquinone oxidoreductase subunit E